MPRLGEFQQIRRNGRKTYYQCRAGGKLVHLGSDALDAARRYDVLVASSDVRIGRPATINGLIAAWGHRHPAKVIPAIQKALIRFGGNRSLAGVTKTFLQDYRDHLIGLGRMPETVIKYGRYAATLIDWAQDQEPPWIETKIRKPKMPKPIQVPHDIAEKYRRALIDALPDPSRPICSFILETGCRPSDATRLDWSEVDLDRGVCVILHKHKATHYGRTRTVYLTPDATVILRAQPGHSGLVFPSPRGGQYTHRGLRCVLVDAGKAVGVKVRGTYDLRHTRLQSALDQGMSIEDVAGLAGHADLNTIQRYAQIRSERLRRAAAGLASPLPPPAPDQPVSPKADSSPPTPAPTACPATKDKSAKARAGVAKKRAAG